MIKEEAARKLYEQMKRRATEPSGFGSSQEFPRVNRPANEGEPSISVDWVVKGGTQNSPAAQNQKPWKPPGDEALLASLHFACLIVEKYLERKGIYIPELDASIRKVNQLMPYWWKLGGLTSYPQAEGYDVRGDAEGEIYNLLKTDGRAAYEIKRRLAKNVLTNAPMTEHTRFLISEIMSGRLESPPPPKREPTNKQRDTLLVALADGVRDRTVFDGSAGPDKYCRGAPCPICGCTIAAAALKASNIRIEPKRSSDIYEEKSKLRLEKLDMGRLLHLPPHTGGTLMSGEQVDVTEKVMKALDYFS
jgi:hypothetical protein